MANQTAYSRDHPYGMAERGLCSVVEGGFEVIRGKPGHMTLQRAINFRMLYRFDPNARQDGNCNRCWKRGTHGEACTVCKTWVRAVDAGIYDEDRFVFNPRIVSRMMGHWGGYDRIQTREAKQPPRKQLTRWSTPTLSPIPLAERTRLKMITQDWESMTMAEEIALWICFEDMDANVREFPADVPLADSDISRGVTSFAP